MTMIIITTGMAIDSYQWNVKIHQFGGQPIGTGTDTDSTTTASTPIAPIRIGGL